jgi:hypothetical protein
VEIHKPKPAHSWREFLSEIGVVVLGVLIALGAEQAVEAVHWSEKVETVQQDLKEELRRDALNMYARMAAKPCIDANITELARRLRAAPGPWSGTTFSYGATGYGEPNLPVLYRSPGGTWSSGVWDAAVAGDIIPHMPRDRAVALGRAYRTIEQLRQWQAEERALAPRLKPLAFDGELDRRERLEFLGVVAQLDSLNYQLSVLSAGSVAELAGNGVLLSKADMQRVLADERRTYGACVATPTLAREG